MAGDLLAGGRIAGNGGGGGSGHAGLLLSRQRAAARLLHRNVDPNGGGNKASAYPVTCTYLPEWFSAGLRPAPATIQSNSNSNSRSWFPEGWGGSGCGRRRKPFHGLAAASMPRTLRNRTHPAFNRVLRSVGTALCVVWWVSTLVDTVDPRHAWMTHSISERKSCRPRSTPTNSRAEQSCSCQQPREPVEGGAVSACGCQPHGCGCQAYTDVLAASPHADTAPPNHGT